MTWEQLAELRDAGVSIQSHTVSHADLRRQKKGTSDGDPNGWLWNELHGSKALLEEKLGIKVTALALPFGLGNEQVRRTAAEAGYEMAFTVNGQKIGFGTPMDALGRYMVQANQPKLFTTATTFEGAGAGGGPGAARLALADLCPQPPDGASIADTDPLIQASLATIDPVDPGSVSVRISGMGLFAARFDPRTRMVQCQARGLMPNKYTVILAAKSGGKKIESRWSFTVESPGGPSPAPGVGSTP